VAHPPKSLQLIISTLTYHGPFDRRSEQQYRRHRGDRSGGRVGSHTILFAALPEFHPIYPKRNLIVPRGAPAVRVTIRSLGVTPAANGRLDSHCCLSLKGIEGGSQQCVVWKQLASFRRTSFPTSLWTQERLFHNWVWEESIEDISNLPAGTKQEGRERQVCRPNPASISGASGLPSPSSHVLRCGCQDPGPNIWKVTSRVALKT
jgi:hypothetical protein